MILYLLLIILFGIIVLISTGLLIFGLIKKRKKLLIAGSIFFIAGAVGCAFSAFTYTKKVVNYVRSKEFQDDAKKGSQLVGETVGSVSSGVSNGLATTLDDAAIARLAKKSAAIIGTSMKTMASALDSTLGNKNIFIDSSLVNSGIELGSAQAKYNANTNDLEIFIDFRKDFDGKLGITNYDQAGKKIDISVKDINAKAGHGQVEVFSFSHSGLGLTTYYIISKVE
jgi:ABC-type transport system involved in multi-copper enzyme maturation permease subunit